MSDSITVHLQYSTKTGKLEYARCGEHVLGDNFKLEAGPDGVVLNGKNVSGKAVQTEVSVAKVELEKKSETDPKLAADIADYFTNGRAKAFNVHTGADLSYTPTKAQLQAIDDNTLPDWREVARAEAIMNEVFSERMSK